MRKLRVPLGVLVMIQGLLARAAASSDHKMWKLRRHLRHTDYVAVTCHEFPCMSHGMNRPVRGRR